ncbi:MAG: abortive infection family protein [Gemmatimonadaceae bacterium]
MKETREALKLLPSDIPEEAKDAEAMKRLLGSLGAVAQGLAELRNLYGTGHGRSGKRRGIEPRHARLASGAAAALVTFLLETHWERQE